MKAVKAMGYDGVELAGLYGMESAVACKKVLDEVGLELISAHVGIDTVEDDAQLSDYAATGLKLIALSSYVPAPKTEEELAFVIERFRKAGQLCKAKGMTLLYHNHDFEFQKIGGKYILDSYYDEVSADLLQTELDVCWVNVGGEDPCAYTRKYAGRMDVIHIKDFAGKKSEHMYALINVKSDARENTNGEFEFRPVGSGVQDIPAILEAAADAGAKWLIVEQDRASMGLDAMESAAMSVKYLKSIME